MHHNIFDNNHRVYDRKKAAKLVLILKKSTKKRLVEKTKVDLFRLMEKIIVKNVKNYSKLARNSPVTEACLDEEELYGECFLIMMKCVEKFNMGGNNCFYFYYNKSLSRSLYRMFDKEVRKKDNHGKFEVFIKYFDKSKSIKVNIEEVRFLIEMLDFTDDEKVIIESKISGERRQEFLERNKNFKGVDYSNCLKSVKSKLIKLKEDGEL